MLKVVWVFSSSVYVCVCARACIREDDKHSLDIHDNPPVPDNVVKEDDDTVSGRTMPPTPVTVSSTILRQFKIATSWGRNAAQP